MFLWWGNPKGGYQGNDHLKLDNCRDYKWCHREPFVQLRNQLIRLQIQARKTEKRCTVQQLLFIATKCLKASCEIFYLIFLIVRIKIELDVVPLVTMRTGLRPYHLTLSFSLMVKTERADILTEHVVPEPEAVRRVGWIDHCGQTCPIAFLWADIIQKHECCCKNHEHYNIYR